MKNKTRPPRPESVRNKISESKKGIPASEYSKQRASETHKGKIVSEETRAKMAKAKIKPVKCMNVTTKEKLKFASTKDCAAYFDSTSTYICFLCKNNKTSKGWTFSY